jgi:hypothetical protein
MTVAANFIDVLHAALLAHAWFPFRRKDALFASCRQSIGFCRITEKSLGSLPQEPIALGAAFAVRL